MFHGRQCRKDGLQQHFIVVRPEVGASASFEVAARLDGGGRRLNEARRASMQRLETVSQMLAILRHYSIIEEWVGYNLSGVRENCSRRLGIDWALRYDTGTLSGKAA